MKKIIIAFAFLFFVFSSKAQDAALQEGNVQANLGLGLSGYGVPLYLGLEYGLSSEFTIGGELSIRNYKDSDGDTDFTRHIVGINGIGNYHFNDVLNIPKNFDFYAGINIGYYIWSSPLANYNDGQGSGLGVGAQIGGRFFFSDNFGGNLELEAGNTITLAKAGITIKF